MSARVTFALGKGMLERATERNPVVVCMRAIIGNISRHVVSGRTDSNAKSVAVVLVTINHGNKKNDLPYWRWWCWLDEWKKWYSQQKGKESDEWWREERVGLVEKQYLNRRIGWNSVTEGKKTAHSGGDQSDRWLRMVVVLMCWFQEWKGTKIIDQERHRNFRKRVTIFSLSTTIFTSSGERGRERECWAEVRGERVRANARAAQICLQTAMAATPIVTGPPPLSTTTSGTPRARFNRHCHFQWDGCARAPELSHYTSPGGSGTNQCWWTTLLYPLVSATTALM